MSHIIKEFQKEIKIVIVKIIVVKDIIAIIVTHLKKVNKIKLSFNENNQQNKIFKLIYKV
jgi:hypothetical protein